MPGDENHQLVLAYRTTDMVEARSLAAELEGADIETQFVGDFRDGAYPGLSIGSLADKELWIAARDEPAANAIVAQWRRVHHPGDLEPTTPPRFSLRALLIVVTLAAVSFALIAVNVQLFAIAINGAVVLLFFFFAGKRMWQRRRDDDDRSASHSNDQRT